MISENTEAKSSFVTYISVKENTRINHHFIAPKVKRFFDAKNISKYKEIALNNDISDLDFKTVEFSYFYDVIFNDIAKNNENIDIPIKYCITFDKKNCLKNCPQTGIFYDEILLYQQPVFYFIYIDINEIFDFLRGER